MKVFLKKAVALVCASAVIAVCYPEIGSSALFAETLKSEEAAKSKNDAAAADVEEKPSRTKSAASESLTAAKIYHATAYALRGRTKSGSPVRRGVIAADPRVLPLGTRVQIAAGNWSGTYLVADTGGVIKGRIIDVWVPNNAQARQFGRRRVTLTVLGK